MCVTSNFLSPVFILMCVHYIHPYSYHGRTMVNISVKGTIISTLLDNQVLLNVGETPEIICTGENAHSLVLYTENELRNLQTLPTYVVNATAIGYVVKKTETPTQKSFACSDLHKGELHSTTLLFDDSPDLGNFHCVSKNLVFLNCTWTTTNVIAGFNLYARNDHGQSSKICDIPVHAVKSSIYDLSCIWARNRPPRYTPDASTLRLLMEYCNYTTCLNQTYEFDHLSIVKLNPPELKLGTLRNGSDYRYIEVRGWISAKTFELLDGVSQKVELWSLPNRQESIKSHSIISSGKGFLIDLELPCYGEIYEVRVSVQTRQATEEEYWSDNASVSFKADTFITEDGEVCEEREIPTTPEIMLNDLHKFRTELKEDQSQSKTKIGELKERVAQIKKTLQIKRNKDDRRDNL